MTLTHLENATFIYQTAKSTYFSLLPLLVQCKLFWEKNIGTHYIQ